MTGVLVRGLSAKSLFPEAIATAYALNHQLRWHHTVGACTPNVVVDGDKMQSHKDEDKDAQANDGFQRNVRLTMKTSASKRGDSSLRLL